MRDARIAVAIGVVALALAAAIVWWRSDARAKRAAAQVDDEELPPPPESPDPGSFARRHVEQDASTPGLPPLDKAKRDAMRIAIYRAWGMAPPDERTSPSTWRTPSAAAHAFDKDYVRDRIRADYLPLAKDCYRQGLAKNPSLGGRLVTSFRIVGTKGTGGLIDWVDMSSEENTLDDRDVLECLKQSLYSVTFDPPPNDGTVTVTYPMTFAAHEPDGGDGGD